MALSITGPIFTLVVDDLGARLWAPDGRQLVRLSEEEPGTDMRRAWGETLRSHLPARSNVQLLLSPSGLEITCQEAPYLSQREQRDVARRMAAAEALGSDRILGHTLDVDSHAQGGRRIWVASLPEADMDLWLDVLAEAKATPLFASPWQRVFLAAQEEAPFTSLYLVLERGLGRIVFYQGRGLVLLRTFRLPEDIDPGHLLPDQEEELQETLEEECGRTIQFIKQKHRSIPVEEMRVVGLAHLSEELAKRLSRGVRVALDPSAQTAGLPLLLLKGLARERSRKGGLNLVPRSVLEARRRVLFRLTAWFAAILLMALTGAAALLMRGVERSYLKEAARAEEGRNQRSALMREAEAAGLARFALLRLRLAEERQAKAQTQLERLGARLLEVPSGIQIERLQVSQAPGDTLLWRFELQGTALSRGTFSMGPLAEYFGRLERHPGMQLQPLREVSVSDRLSAGPDGRGDKDRAVTVFQISGITP